MSYSRTVSQEALKVHREAIVIDALANFCEGFDDNLALSGITAMNVSIADSMSDNIEGTLEDIADHYLTIRGIRN